MDIKNLLGPIVFGIIFGYIIYRTGSILAGMLAHFTNNSFAMLLSYLDKNYHEQFPFLEDGNFVIVGFVISVVVLALIFWLSKYSFQWNIKPKIASFKADMRAAFLNVPALIALGMYVFFTIFEILQVLYPDQLGGNIKTP